MFGRSLGRLVVNVSFGLCCLLATGLAAAQDAASVVFVSGSCQWSVPGGVVQPMVTGQRLPVGARLEAGADGHAYLVTVDKGFLALRPQTVVRITRYDAAEGMPVDIRLLLERGTARVVSGSAAKRAPAGFRMETPLAVIGVRGTDFSVRMADEATRVAVRSGGVVVSPFSDVCHPGSAGPCEKSAAVELFAREIGHIVEVKRGAAQPLKLLLPADAGPDGKAPPAPGENRYLEQPRGARSGSASLAATPLDVNREASLTSALDRSASSPVPAPTVFWGRWSGSGNAASDDASFRALTAGRENVAMNAWFVLSREPGVPLLPHEGRVTLGLAGADALIVSQAGHVIAPAQVSNGRLLLDFSRQRFETALTTQGGGYTADFRGNGPIYPDGTFASSWLAGTTGTMAGAIEPAARGASYMYSQPITNSQAVATGVTNWVR